ncbi:MAG: SDR family NAD(P)-dependent oxidoreductase, partial [Pseudomonadota bacterium]
MMETRFANKRAVVTGGAAGIGAAIATRIAAEGGTVMVWDRDADATASISEKVDTIHGMTVDLTDPEAVNQAAAATAEKLGGIDVLVCSAG